MIVEPASDTEAYDSYGFEYEPPSQSYDRYQAVVDSIIVSGS